MTVRQMRDLLGMSAQKFGDKYNIPMRSIQNWESGASKCPEYVMELLERAVWEDYEEEYGKIKKYSVESTDMNATYDLHLYDTDDLEDAKIMARKFVADGFPAELVLTKEFLTGSYNPIEF